MAELIIITGGKGGVGKSAVCALLGAALTRAGKRTLLLETGQRSLDVFLGCDNLVYDLGDLLAGRCAPGEAVVRGPGVDYICAPPEGFVHTSPAPEARAIWELLTALEDGYDYILAEVPHREELLRVFAELAERAVIVCTPDRASARGGRMASDLLASQGVWDIRLCVNMVPPDFIRTRPIPHLDWLIDAVCAQLISVVSFEPVLISGAILSDSETLSKNVRIIFDNFAQRIMGNYIDLWVW